MNDTGDAVVVCSAEEHQWKALLKTSWVMEEDGLRRKCPVEYVDLTTVANLLKSRHSDKFINGLYETSYTEYDRLGRADVLEWRTMLHAAAFWARWDLVRLLLDHGANPNIACEDGETPLMAAAEIGETEMIQLMVDHGANTLALTEKGWSAVDIANLKATSEVVQLLLDLMLHQDDSPQEKVPIMEWAKLMLAIFDLYEDEEFGYEDAHIQTSIQQWMERPNVTSFINWTHPAVNRGSTMLLGAVWLKRIHIIEALLEHGANADIADMFGRSPLMVASRNGDTETLKLLLTNGANVQLRDNEGKTALYHACKMGHLSCIPLLLSHGADANAKDTEHHGGLTPLHLVCINAQDCEIGSLLEMIKLLIENGGGDQNIQDDYHGMSALHWACWKGCLEVVQLLLCKSRGQNLNLKTALGSRTPLQIASARNHSDIVWFLMCQYHWLFLPQGVIVNHTDGPTTTSECVQAPPRKRAKCSTRSNTSSRP